MLSQGLRCTISHLSRIFDEMVIIWRQVKKLAKEKSNQHIRLIDTNIPFLESSSIHKRTNVVRRRSNDCAVNYTPRYMILER